MPTNKFNIVEIVNRRFLNPRNIISALTDKLSHQFGTSIPLGMEDMDPSGSSGEGDTDIDFAVPPEPFLLTNEDDVGPDSYEPGTTVEEMLSGNGGNYITTLPVDFFRAVWFDGLLANYNEHYTMSGSNALVPNTPLLSGTEVYGRYVIGYDQ